MTPAQLKQRVDYALPNNSDRISSIKTTSSKLKLVLKEMINTLQNEEIVADENVQANWLETDTNSDAFIKNKPLVADTITVENGKLVLKAGNTVIGQPQTLPKAQIEDSFKIATKNFSGFENKTGVQTVSIKPPIGFIMNDFKGLTYSYKLIKLFSRHPQWTSGNSKRNVDFIVKVDHYAAWNELQIKFEYIKSHQGSSRENNMQLQVVSYWLKEGD